MKKFSQFKLPESVVTNHYMWNFSKYWMEKYSHVRFMRTIKHGLKMMQKGVYRYFTKTAKAKNAIALTIMDFLEVLGDVDVSSTKKLFLIARRMLAFILSVEYDEFAWE